MQAAIAFAVALVATVIGVVLVSRSLRMSELAVATIIEHEPVEMAEGHAYRTKIEFDDPRFGLRVAVLGAPSFPAWGRVGEQVVIRYAPTNSGLIARDSTLGRWGWAAFLFVLAASMCAVGVYELLQ